MIMKQIVMACLPAALLVASCAVVEPRYMKPDVPDAKIADELKSCRADSEEAMSDLKKNAGLQRREQSEIIDQCMRAKGFARASLP